MASFRWLSDAAKRTRLVVWPIALFRLCCGIALVLFFADHYANSVSLISEHGLYDEDALRALGVPVRTAAWLTQRSPGALRAIFAGAIVLSVLGGAGVLPRACSGILFVLAVLTGRALHPVNHLDDYLAAATLFWLALLPSAGSPATRAFWRADAKPPVSDGTIVVFIAYVAVLYLGLGLRSLPEFGAGWSDTPLPLLGCLVVPALVIAPGAWPKAIGAALQAVLHGYFLVTTGLVVSHLLLLATGVLLWVPTFRGTEQRLRISAPAVLGTMHVAVFAAVLLLPRIHPPLSRPAMSRLLFDNGLLPAERHELPKAPFALQVSLPDRSEVVVRSGHVRFQLLLARLSGAVNGTQLDALRQDLARRLMVRYCRTGTNPAPGSALVFAPSGASTRWYFTCSPSDGSDGKGPYAPTMPYPSPEVSTTRQERTSL
jgi:hypothetical protein